MKIIFQYSDGKPIASSPSFDITDEELDHLLESASGGYDEIPEVDVEDKDGYSIMTFWFSENEDDDIFIRPFQEYIDELNEHVGCNIPSYTEWVIAK